MASGDGVHLQLFAILRFASNLTKQIKDKEFIYQG